MIILNNEEILQYFKLEKDIMDLQDIVDENEDLEYEDFIYTLDDIDKAIDGTQTLDEKSLYYWCMFFKGIVQKENTLWYRYTSLNQLLLLVLDILIINDDMVYELAKEEIKLYKANKREWSTFRLIRIMEQFYDMDVNVERLDETGIIAYKKMIEAFFNDYYKAKELLAYSYYGGDKAYPCDFYKAKELLEELMVINKDYEAKYANSLGYIYYYGRCNRGVPEYDKAYTCFVMGEQAGYYESTYKLADMYLHGYYVQKNERHAYLMVNKLFDNNFNQFRKGRPSNLADVALRLANMRYDGQGCRQDYEEAFWLYLLAYESIKYRDYYGDSKVIRGIEDGISKCKKHFNVKNPVDKKKAAVPYGLLCAFQSEHVVKVVVDKEEEGCIISTTLVPYRNGENEKIVTLDFDEAYLRFKDEVYDYCDRHPIETMNRFMEEKYDVDVDSIDDSITFYADNYEIHEDMIFFFLFDKEVMSFKGGEYTYYLNDNQAMN